MNLDNDTVLKAVDSIKDVFKSSGVLGPAPPSVNEYLDASTPSNFSSVKIMNWFSNNHYEMSIGLTIVHGIMLVFWLGTNFWYKKVYEENEEVWKTLPEFPIARHAYFVNTQHHKVFMVVLSVLVPIQLLAFKSTILFFTFTMIVFFFFFFILMMFGQVYQVLIAITVYRECSGNSRANLTDQQKQKEKQLWKQYLYGVFVIRDIILVPLVMLLDRRQEGTRPETFYFTRIYVAKIRQLEPGCAESSTTPNLVPGNCSIRFSSVYSDELLVFAVEIPVFGNYSICSPSHYSTSSTDHPKYNIAGNQDKEVHNDQE
ncbi:hypothetical protein CAEBREN_08368 [Caenorhabditis brenneri]|uniref:Uncharacterized protein n=1 Tax=Caenorhabditis brenneri TaxID=135651 RepID=G0M9U2_CAEBE|nr:hypothetical protein CAEBREN_08368 [Caenorhabditis brenneri]